MAGTTIDQVVFCPSLPSLHAVAMEVLELTRNHDVTLDEIAKCVQNDQALTGKILKTINSSFYGLSQPCPTISRAIAYLGLNAVKSLVLSFSLVDTFGRDSDNGFDFQRYWRRSIYSAAAARAFADVTRTWDTEEVFIAALLQDVGMIAMLTKLGAPYAEVCNAAGDDHESLSSHEQKAFEFTHMDVGARLAEKWRLPQELTIPIRHHHGADAAPKPYHRICRLLTLGYWVAQVLTIDDRQRCYARVRELGKQWFGLEQLQIDALTERVAKDAVELSRLFQLQTGDAPNAQVILAEAGEALVRHQLEVVQENQQLQHQTITDGLTGAFNRRHFDSVLGDEFRKARHGGSVAVALTDADRFKSVNDTYGHQAGDAVLIELASRLQRAVGESGIVCRYGGEEFAAILPGHSARRASEVAEAMRSAVEAAPFDLRHVNGAPDALPVTISVGAAALDDSSCDVLTTVERLVKAADKGVYAAKSAGRNCVRVFQAHRAAVAA